MANYLSSPLPTTSISLSGSTASTNLSSSSSISATFLKLSESALNSSFSATSAPIKIENENLAPGSTGNSVAETAAGSSSAASSFSTGLNSLYVASVPESLLFPFISQQAASAVRQHQQQQQQQHNLASSLNNRSLATSVHPLLSSQPQHFSAFSLRNTNSTVSSTLFDTETKISDADLSQFNSNNLASSLPPMNLLLNNFISNSNKSLNASKEIIFSKQMPIFGSSVPSMVPTHTNSGKIQ